MSSSESPLEKMLAAGIPREMAINRTMQQLIVSAMAIGVGMALKQDFKVEDGRDDMNRRLNDLGFPDYATLFELCDYPKE
jgi:hypothetical protein